LEIKLKIILIILGILFAIGFGILLYTFEPFGLNESFDLNLIFLGIPLTILTILIFIFYPKERKAFFKDMKGDLFGIIISPVILGLVVSFVLIPYTTALNSFVGKQEIKIIKGIVVQRNKTEMGWNLDLEVEYKKKENKIIKVLRRYINLHLNSEHDNDIKVSVIESLYDSVKVGDVVNVKLRVGCLGIEYQFLSDKWDGKNVYLDEKVNNKKEEVPNKSDSN
jgi:hypothetical protein